MVLDGAVDPTLDGVHSLLGQARGYQIAWDSFAADCAARPACPMGHSAAEAGAALDALVGALHRAPLRQGKDMVVDGDSLISAVTTALLASAWEKLRAALREVRTGDTTTVQELGGAFEDSGFSGDAYVAITCLSGSLGARATPAQARAALPEFLRASPASGATSRTSCRPAPTGRSRWTSRPVPSPRPVRRRSWSSAPPGTRRPLTPRPGPLRACSPRAGFLTYDGDGHTAYLRSVGCVDEAVDGYLVRGQSPPAYTVCT